MISNKKSYAMKMLQLALALSLLQVDPDNYLYQNLGSWDSQLELRDGDGWELEMLRAVPMVEYPYANRKTMMPLIEDLVRFDRQHSNANQYNVTAYLLNVQSDGGNQTAAAMQELQATSATSATTTATTAASSTSSPGAMALEQAAGIVTSNASSIGIGSHDLDVFLNSEHFQDQISVWEQNLADLNDFGELPGLNTYAGLPMKEEPSNNTDFHLDVYLPGLADADLDRLETERAVALNDTFPNPSDTTTIKVEQLTNGTDVGDVGGAQDSDDVATCSASMSSTTASLASSTSTIPEVVVKQEVKTENVPETEELSPFISQVELTKEESEIVEVLWKQDVDLGYTLTPPLLGNASEASGSGTGANTKSVASMSDDDAEKLKALEELKHDKLKFDPKDEQLNEDLSDEWAGIPFTIDNETGEYIRLPLDDLFNDVLQLANFVNDDEIDDDSVASTSRAAVNKINSNNNREGTGNNSIKSKVEGDDEEEDDDEEDDDENNKKANNKVDDDDDNEGEDSNGNNNNNRKSKKNKSKRNNNNNKEKESRPELSDDDDLSQSEIDVRSLPSPLFDLDDEAKEELADLEIMIQSAAPPFHHHHHHGHHRPGPGVQNYPVGGGANSAFHRQATGFHHSHHQGRVPLSRGVSMEQRLQDIASLFNPIPSMGVGVGVSEMAPYPHYPSHHYAYQGGASLPAPPPQHAQYPPPHHHHHHHGHHAAMLHANGNVNVNVNGSLGELCPPSQPHYGHNLGSAVSSSMHLTNSSHDGDVGGAGAAGNAGAYKMEHDMMYYSNVSSDMNHTTDGFINSILNDEDLHLMDMNVNESFCRMVDVNNSTSNNSSVLGGLSSGHASGGGTTGSSTNGLSMSAAQAAASGPAPGGMTADLMNAAGATGGDRLDASSDSAVSSMGSERVPSLSDGEWGEGSDSAQDYHQGKYGGPYDYSYSNSNNNNNRLNDGSRQPPVAQKKHQMFGKRYLQEQPGLGAAGGNNGATNGPTGANDLLQQQQGPTPGVKYEYDPYPSVGLAQGGGVNNMAEGAMGPAISKEMQPYELKYGPSGLASGYSLDFSLRPPRTPNDIVQHNHTYTMPQGSGSLPRPQQRDKKTSTSSSKSSSKSSTNGDDEHLTRDEKRARALSIPIPVADIINLPMDEFNERLSKYELTENQLSLIRDIRRRGKNKVAAQNCRKRKLDQILTLEDEVKQVRRRKEQLCQDRDSLAAEHKRISTKFATLHRHIFQYLRDPEGNPCSPSEYSLQQATDGSIYLLPRDSNKADGAGPTAGGPSTAPNGGGGNNGGVNGHMSHSQHHPHIAQSHAAHLHAQQQQQQQHQQQHHPHHAQQQATHSLPHHPHAHHTTTTTTQQHPHHPHQKD